MEPREAINQARNIIARMKNSELTYDEAKTLCKPLFDTANNKGKEIAKKYNMRYKNISFAAFAR